MPPGDPQVQKQSNMFTDTNYYKNYNQAVSQKNISKEGLFSAH